MVNRVKVKFDGKKFGQRLFNRIAEEQTKRLIEYAKEEIVRIVESKAFDDRTANLSDSYVWCVYFDNKRKGFGYYGNRKAKTASYLHEYSRSMRQRLDGGRNLAKQFADFFYVPTTPKGWEIVFAAVIPYGAYLEEGFTFHGRRYQFNVMSQRYDHIKNTLSPLCKVTFEVHTPKY